MNIQRLKRLRVAILGVSIILATSVFGCGPIQLIAPYDKKIDQGITELQTMTATFFAKIERQKGSTREDYENHIKFYDNVRAALSVILVRAKAVANNRLTVGQLEDLRQQFRKLEADHQKLGIHQAAIPHYESAFNRTFRAILTLEMGKKGLK